LIVIDDRALVGGTMAIAVKWAFFTVAVLASAAVAVAADGATAAPLAPAYSWIGWYGGVNAGAVWGNENVAWTAKPGPGGFDAAGANDINISSPGQVRPSGFTGGGQLGYNFFQSQSVVVGLEGDAEYTGLNGTRSLISQQFQNPFAQSVQSNWLGTIRGRLGIAYGSALFYGTGGLAIAQVKFTDSFLGLHGVGPINASVSDTRVGWSAGGGAEWAFAPGWSGRIEYLHADLGSVANVGMSAFNAALINNAHSLTENLVRLGVNYRWGGGPFLTR
jgi:outer membrane immunogenic protein